MYKNTVSRSTSIDDHEFKMFIIQYSEFVGFQKLFSKEEKFHSLICILLNDFITLHS